LARHALEEGNADAVRVEAVDVPGTGVDTAGEGDRPVKEDDAPGGQGGVDDVVVGHVKVQVHRAGVRRVDVGRSSRGPRHLDEFQVRINRAGGAQERHP
jgi:hypothetical protein